MVKDGFGNSPKIRRIADLRLNKLKAVLAVCALRVFLVYRLNAFSRLGFVIPVHRRHHKLCEYDDDDDDDE